MEVTFRYFARPHAFSHYQDEPRQCDICGRERTGYAGPFYCTGDLEFVCEECLATGKLSDYDASTNDGDIGALQEQLEALYPEMGDEERQALARDRTDELEQRTPNMLTWQDWFWPAHCGDYCRFIKEVGVPDLVALAPDADGIAFFAAHCPDVHDIGHAREVFSGIRSDAPENGTVAYSVGVYLFQCLACGEYVICWECD